MTVQPIAFAILIAVEPMPEPPACTRMVSPGSSLALSNSMCSTVAQAASRIGTPAGTGMTRRASMLMSSRANPSTWKPRIPLTFSHRLSRPSRQARQVPQVSAPYITTGSPGLNAVTSGPTAAISPAASAPITSGSLRWANAMPRKPHRSRGFKPTALTPTRTSPACGGGGGARSASSILRSATRVSARIVTPDATKERKGSAVDAYRRRESAVNRQHRAGHVGGLRRGEERHHGGDIVRRREPPRRDLLFHLLAVLLVGRYHGGIDEGGRDVIDGHAGARPVDRERAHVAEQGGFRPRIGGVALVGLQRGDRADHRDAAELRPHHRPHHGVHQPRERPVVHLHGGFRLGLVHHDGERV